MSESNEFESLGRMVFGMISDVLIMPPGDGAYGRRTVTLPDGHGGKHAVEIIIARAEVAEVMERAVRAAFNVGEVKAGGPTQ